jgi:HTH-type transcriptional regulator, transcriptional repressor of NAD biosynthesis genes
MCLCQNSLDFTPHFKYIIPNNEYNTNNLNNLEANVRSYYIPRIILVGAESTGKTTLAKRLVDNYSRISVWVPEYLKIWCEDKIKNVHDPNSIPLFDWTTSDFLQIALDQ